MRLKLIVLATLLVAFPYHSFAQNFQDPESSSNREARKFCREALTLKNALLNDLSEIQESALKEELRIYRDTLEETAPERREARKGLFESIHRPSLNYNEENIRAAHQELATLQEEVAVVRALLFSSLYPEILTTSQYRTLVAFEVYLRGCLNGPTNRARSKISDWIGEDL